VYFFALDISIYKRFFCGSENPMRRAMVFQTWDCAPTFAPGKWLRAGNMMQETTLLPLQ